MIKLLSINEYFQRNDSNLKLMDNIVKRIIYKYAAFIMLKILKDDFIKFLDKLKILTK